MFRSSVPRMFTTIANTRYLLLPAGFSDSGIGFVNERRLCFHSAVILPPRVSPYDSLYICLHVITPTTYWFSIGHSCRFILTLSRRILLIQACLPILRHESVFVSLMGSWLRGSSKGFVWRTPSLSTQVSHTNLWSVCCLRLCLLQQLLVLLLLLEDLFRLFLDAYECFSFWKTYRMKILLSGHVSSL